MKINWFSPLPPARTEIAQYTARILPALAARAEISLWTDQSEWDASLERHARICVYRPGEVTWRDLNLAQHSFYHVGNNHGFHGSIWEVSRQHPGIVVLHEHCLQDFFAAVYKETGQHADYIANMFRYYGWAGKDAADKFLSGVFSTEFMSQKFPLNALAVDSACGVVIHTRDALSDLQQHKRWPLVYAPLPFPASEQPADVLERRFYKYQSGPPYRLIIFGYIGQNRRLETVLEALAEFPRRELFRLDVYGNLWQPAPVLAKIQALDLEPMVALHGFVAEQTLKAALESAHLAINLRFPTMGEASASQLRIWNHALPSLVTRVGWYAAIPEKATAFVRPEHEKSDIHAHWTAFLSDPASFAAQGRHGRQLLEKQHQPDTYAEALLQFAEQLPHYRSRSVAFQLADRVSTELSAWTSSEQCAEDSRKVAEEIWQMVA
jgi:hypothetical protein